MGHLTGLPVPGRVCAVSSRADPAGSRIHAHLEEIIRKGTVRNDSWKPEFVHIKTGERLIHADHIDRDVDAELILFLSRHASVRPVPLLTVHVTGNIAGAELGGLPGRLPPACPVMMKAVLVSLADHAPPGYGVSYEMTHHGPTELETPSFFVEVGSTEKEWNDEVATRAAARAILSARPEPDQVPLIGFGGTHYSPRQTEIALKSRAAFGHMIPSRQAGSISPGLVSRMAVSSGAVAAYIDRKSFKADELASITALVRKAGLPVVTGSEITGLGSLDLDTYLQIRDIARNTVKGGVVSPNALSGQGNPVVVDIGEELARAALQADPSALSQGIAKTPAASVQSGRSPVSGQFITFEPLEAHVRHDLIRLCVSIILSKEKASISGDTLIIQRRRFDPGKARKLGIPSGPLYGMLRSGETVHIGGEEVTPDMVMGEEPERFTIPGLSRYL